MVLRAVALAVAVLVAAAPSALAVCEIVCAARAHEADAHSCHHGDAAPVTAVGGGTHICGHSDALPDAARDTAPKAAPAAADLPPALDLAAGLALDAPSRPRSVSPSPPGRLLLATPLRI